MVRKIPRLPLIVGLCSAAGIILGATASQAEINQCLTAQNPSHQCLTQDPLTKRIEGMGMGLFAGAGAAIAATWQLGQKKL
jgi:hypothetical protein